MNDQQIEIQMYDRYVSVYKPKEALASKRLSTLARRDSEQIIEPRDEDGIRSLRAAQTFSGHEKMPLREKVRRFVDEMATELFF